MKLGVYIIVNNPLPQLLEITNIDVKKEDFEYERKIVEILRKKLNMGIIDVECTYALSLTYGLIPKGLLLLGMGNNKECIENLRGLGIGLLLTGAEQFMVFHNHPGGSKKPSGDDLVMTEKYKKLGDIIGIEFLKHIMITKDFYTDCININELIYS